MTGNFARFEKQEHGTGCKSGRHIPYRCRSSRGTEIRCKLCYDTQLVTKETNDQAA